VARNTFQRARGPQGKIHLTSPEPMIYVDHHHGAFGMVFFAFVLLIVIAFLLWRIAERVPDLLFHLSEIQKDMDAVRRHVEEKQVD
jgi:hypothetical protein